MSLQSQKIEFEFGKSYTFEGVAYLNSKTLKEDITSKCKCEILMSPSEIKIILTSDRHFSNLCELEVEIVLKNKKYYLFAFNLKLLKGRSIDKYHTTVFLAECITIGEKKGELWFDSIKIKTDCDADIIGKSELQYKLLYNKNQIDNNNEIFIDKIQGKSFLISYDLEDNNELPLQYYVKDNTNNLIAYKKIIPFSAYYSSKSLHLIDSIAFIKSYISFLSLLKGFLVNIKEVRLYSNKNSDEKFLYFPHYIKNKKRISLFTLNQYDDNTFKKIPNIDSIFLKFLKNPDVVENFDLWTLLNLLTKLKLFSVNEERFLFSYRIIEKFSDSMNKDGMNSKIESLVSKHKEFLELIKIDNCFLKQIKKLRNDISHANFYYIDGDSFRDLLWKTEIFSYYLTLTYLGFEKGHIINRLKGIIKELSLLWYNDSYKIL